MLDIDGAGVSPQVSQRVARPLKAAAEWVRFPFRVLPHNISSGLRDYRGVERGTTAGFKAAAGAETAVQWMFVSRCESPSVGKPSTYYKVSRWRYIENDQSSYSFHRGHIPTAHASPPQQIHLLCHRSSSGCVLESDLSDCAQDPVSWKYLPVQGGSRRLTDFEARS